jgi:LysM repeat protein
MKRISIFLTALALCGTPIARGQDAATKERLDQLSGQISDINDTLQAFGKRLDALAKDVENLRDQASKPAANYASQDELKRIADALTEVDRKRKEDAEKIATELLNIRKGLLKDTSPPPGKKSHGTPPPEKTTSDKPQEGFNYDIKSGDTLGAIAQAYKEKGVKVTVQQILDANPGLKAGRLIVGKTIFIPAPKP